MRAAAVVLLGLLSLPSCYVDGSSEAEVDSVPFEIADPALNRQAFELLSLECGRCHHRSSDGGFYYVMDLDHMVRTGMVVPGSAAASRIFGRVRNGSMPPAGRLPKASIELLRSWIDRGLKPIEGPTGPTGPEEPPVNIAFPEGATENTKRAMTTLHRKCYACHNPTDGDKLGGGVVHVYDPAQLVISGLVHPGDSASSPLYQAVFRERMPKRGQALAAEEIESIRLWIDQDFPKNPKDAKPLAGYTPVPLAPTYASIRANILSTRCLLCHGGEYGTMDHVDFRDYEGVKKMLRPGLPLLSILWIDVDNGKMPIDGVKLKKEEAKAISDWIGAGAKP